MGQGRIQGAHSCGSGGQLRSRDTLGLSEAHGAPGGPSWIRA